MPHIPNSSYLQCYNELLTTTSTKTKCNAMDKFNVVLYTAGIENCNSIQNILYTLCVPYDKVT